MEYSQVGHFGWILAPILILDRETQNVYLEHGKFQVLGHIFYKSFCRALGSQFHLGAVHKWGEEPDQTMTRPIFFWDGERPHFTKPCLPNGQTSQ